MKSSWLRRNFVRFIVVVCATLGVGITTAIPAQAAWPIGGAILTEYNQRGGYGFFGPSTSPESPAEQEGRYQTFNNTNQSIYWKASVANGKANQIGGYIRGKYGSLDWERSYLGFPTTHELAGAKPGRYNLFQFGGIYWPQGATDAFAVKFDSEIYRTWADNTWEHGTYGYPVSDEYNFDGGRRQDFQGGSIVWKPDGFAEDYEGDGTVDYAADCEQNTTCGFDARGVTVGSQKLGTPPPGGGLFPGVPGGRSAAPAEECSTSTTPASEPSSPASDDNAAPNGPSTPAGSEPTTPSNTTTPSETTAPADTSRGPLLPSQADTTTSVPSSSESLTPAPTTSESAPALPSQENSVVTWCRGEAESDAPPSANRAPETSMCAMRLNSWYASRRDGCYVKKNTAFIARNTQLQEIGRIEGIESMSVNPEGYTSTEFVGKYSFEVTKIENFLTSALSVESTCAIRFGGTGPCDGAAQSVNDVFLTVGTVVNLESPHSINVGAPAAGQIKFGQVRFTIQVIATVPPTDGPSPGPYRQELQTSRVRCDSAPQMRNTRGCVIADTIPVWDLTSESNLNEYRDHVAFGQQSGLPGGSNLAGDGATLSRTTDGTIITSNRRNTCGKVTAGPTGRPAGKSCDEYPMAATNEGGTAPARTFPQCGIPNRENRPVLSTPNPENLGGGSSMPHQSGTELASWLATVLVLYQIPDTQW